MPLFTTRLLTFTTLEGRALEKIKVGDQVRFEAANLTMTVQQVAKNYCVCSWIEGPHERTFVFPHHVLSKVIEGCEDGNTQSR